MDAETVIPVKTNTLLIYIGIGLILVILAIALSIFALLRKGNTGPTGSTGPTGASIIGPTGATGAIVTNINYLYAVKNVNQVVTVGGFTPTVITFNTVPLINGWTSVITPFSGFRVSTAGIYKVGYEMNIFTQTDLDNSISFGLAVNTPTNGITGSASGVAPGLNQNAFVNTLTVGDVLVQLNAGDSIIATYASLNANIWTINTGSISIIRIA